MKHTAFLLFLCMALLSCGKEEPPLDESLPIGEFDELWPGKVLGCGVPLNLETDKPLASFEELKNADCDTLIFSKERHRDKWDELARLGDCSDGGGAEMDYRAIFRESATGKIVLGIGREGRTLQLEDGRKCAVAEENVLDVCRIYNELFGTPESQIFCPRPLWIAGKAAADSGASRLKWRESDWARLKRERAELGESAVAVYGIDLATKFRSRVDPAWLVGPDAGSDVRRTVLTSEQARRFVRLFREAGKCSFQEIPIAYRAFGIDMRGRFVFGIGESAFELAVHVGKDEYCLIPFGKRTPVWLLYEEIFPSNAPRTADECEVVAKAVVDSILRGDMKYPSHFKNGFEADCPFDLFRKDLRKGPAKCRAHRLAQTFRFLDGEYPELILPAFTESFLLAARGHEKIAWDEDLCLALRHIYWLNTDELIQPLVKAGFTYDALDQRCHFGKPKPTPLLRWFWNDELPPCRTALRPGAAFRSAFLRCAVRRALQPRRRRQKLPGNGRHMPAFQYLRFSWRIRLSRLRDIKIRIHFALRWLLCRRSVCFYGGWR